MEVIIPENSSGGENENSSALKKPAPVHLATFFKKLLRFNMPIISKRSFFRPGKMGEYSDQDSTWIR
jgi:hypothetical protein